MGLSDFFDDVADFVSDIPVVGKIFDVVRENPRTSLLLAAGIGGIAAMGGFSGLLGTGGATAGATTEAATTGAATTAEGSLAGLAPAAQASPALESIAGGATSAEGALAGMAPAAQLTPAIETAAAPSSFLDTLSGGVGKIGQLMFGTPTRTMVTGQLLQGAGNYLSAEEARKLEQKRYEDQMAMAREQMAQRRVNVVGGPITSTSFRSGGPIGSAMNSGPVSMSPSEALHLRRTGQL